MKVGAAHAGTPTAMRSTAMAPATAGKHQPELHRDQQRDPQTPRAHVVLDHDLQPEDRVPGQRADHEQQQRRRQRRTEPRPHAVQVDAVESRTGRRNEPDAEYRQRDRAQPLCVPVPDPSFAEPSPSTRPSGLREAHAHLPEARHAARTTAPRRARAKRWLRPSRSSARRGSSKPYPASQHRCRTPFSKW